MKKNMNNFAYLLSFLLKFFNGTFINTTTFVNQMTSGGGLARVNMSNDNNVNMNLLLTHDEFMARLLVNSVMKQK